MARAPTPPGGRAVHRPPPLPRRPPAAPNASATDTASVTVIHPALTLSKSPNSQTVQTGATVTFTLAVTNTGDVSLSNVQVSDALAPNCSANLSTLAAGASTSYACSLSNVTASFVNSATVTGTPPAGSNVS